MTASPSRDDLGVDDEELREWLAAIVAGIMKLAEQIEQWSEEDDDGEEEADSA